MSTWTYGDVLKAARTRRGMSQEDVARKLGVKLGAYGSWERGTHTPRPESVVKMIELFNLPPHVVGYEAPVGWELVPAKWIRDEFTDLHTKLDKIINRQEKPR